MIHTSRGKSASQKLDNPAAISGELTVLSAPRMCLCRPRLGRTTLKTALFPCVVFHPAPNKFKTRQTRATLDKFQVVQKSLKILTQVHNARINILARSPLTFCRFLSKTLSPTKMFISPLFEVSDTTNVSGATRYGPFTVAIPEQKRSPPQTLPSDAEIVSTCSYVETSTCRPTSQHMHDAPVCEPRPTHNPT